MPASGPTAVLLTGQDGVVDVVDTLVLLVLVVVSTAGVQDRNAGHRVLEQLRFAVLPRRWVVERTFAWLVRCRRLDRDYERLPTTSEVMIKWAMIGIVTRRLEPAPRRRPWQPAKAA